MSDADVRLVPITREQRDRLSLHGWRRESDAWDAAPADPAETVLRQMKAGPALQALCDGTGDEWLTGAILEALGFVVSSTETSTPDA